MIEVPELSLLVPALEANSAADFATESRSGSNKTSVTIHLEELLRICSSAFISLLQLNWATVRFLFQAQ